jgi:peptide deformylase
LAANQIGEAKRVFIVDLSAIDINESLRVFINPEIMEASGDPIEMEEGCLSFPDLYLKVTRPSKVRVRAYDLDGQRFELAAEGMAARAILHEYDHLEGKLFIDRVSPLTRTLIKGRLKKLAKAS